jgi:hypothetical protein
MRSMNLTELARYKDPNLEFDPDTFISIRHSMNGSRWIGFDLKPSPRPQMRLKNVLGLRPFASFPETLGWQVARPDDLDGVDHGARTAHLRLQDSAGAEIAHTAVSVAAGRMMPVQFDWPLHNLWSDRDVDLSVHLDSDAAGPLFLAVSRLLRRSDLISQIRGTGVEIGPGMSPQIFPGPDINVLYVDEMTKEDWEKTYAYKREKWEGDAIKVDFSLYRSGGALNLPVENGSLDFIFGSHVFEHLVNPLQHVANWLGKLKSGGRIYMIIPYARASLDYRQATSTMPDLLAEYQSGGTALEFKHYKRIFGAKAEKAFAEHRSLHVHFYTPELLADIFEYAGANLGLKRYRIHHHDNYRELFFSLEKA